MKELPEQWIDPFENVPSVDEHTFGAAVVRASELVAGTTILFGEDDRQTLFANQKLTEALGKVREDIARWDTRKSASNAAVEASGIVYAFRHADAAHLPVTLAQKTRYEGDKFVPDMRPVLPRNHPDLQFVLPRYPAIKSTEPLSKQNLYPEFKQSNLFP